MVSAVTMGRVDGRRVRHLRGIGLTLATWAALGSQVAVAQQAQEPDGIEAALMGSRSVVAGESLQVVGRAFRVRGLSTLRSYARAPVQTRLVEIRPEGEDGAEGPWVRGRADASGDFLLELPAPASFVSRARVEVEIGEGDAARSFGYEVRLRSPISLTLKTDRRFYQAGETMRVWLLARHPRTLAPIAAGAAVEFSLDGQRHVRAQLGEGGVAAVDFPIAESTPNGEWSVLAKVQVGDHEARAALGIQVGQRTSERLMAELSWDETQVAPSDTFEARVRVTAPSGAPVRGATVTLTVQGRPPQHADTDRDGVARFTARAPAYLTDQTGLVTVGATVAHAAHGRAELSRRLRLSAPLALHVEATARTGRAVVGVPSDVYVAVLDAAGDPPPAGTEVVLRGAGLRRPIEARTDDNGFVAATLTLPPDHVGALAACGGEVGAMLDVEVRGERARRGRVCVKAAPGAGVQITAESPVVAPGEDLVLRLRRSAELRRAPVRVELAGPGGWLAATAVVPPGRDRVTLRTTSLGVVTIAAIPILGEDAEAFLGVEHSTTVLVRPARPSFVAMEAERDLYPVGGEAALVVRTEPGQPGWLALDVRDRTQHGGERPFAMRFLDGAFRRAVLDPQGEGAAILVRAALGARHANHGAAGELETYPALVDEFGVAVEAPDLEPNGLLRDPVLDARRLERWGVGEVMVAIEDALRSADAIEDIVVGEGRARRFRDDLASELMDARTLGDRPLTPAMITASDASFTFESVARRIARERLLQALHILHDALQESEDEPAELARQPAGRWIATLVREGALGPQLVRDPWGGALGLRARPAGVPPVAAGAGDQTLAYPGPDGRLGTADDVMDPFARVVSARTPYAVASGEDEWMRTVASLSPGRAALEGMLAAYRRVTAQMRDARIADALVAGASEGYGGTGEGTIGLGNLGTIGHGGGGGTGSGYGRGAGGLRGRSSRVPRIRAGMASVTGAPSLLSGLIREDMPATLLFLPRVAVDPSGVTRIPVPLAHAATTYVCEVVHWRADGWSWSDAADLRVDQELVVDAPVPRFAHVGDRVELPLRAANRGGQVREVTLSVHPEGELGLEAIGTEALSVPPGDARVHAVALDLAQVGEGRLVVQGTAGDLRDATRRSIEVLAAARPGVVRREALVMGEGTLTIPIPAQALPRAGGRVTLHGAERLFSTSPLWRAWARRRALGADPSSAAIRQARERIGGGPPLELATALVALGDQVGDRQLRRVISGMTSFVRGGPEQAQAVERAAVLMVVLSALPEDDERTPIVRLRRRLREIVTEGAAARSDDPALQAAAAAAFAYGGDEDRAAEHARRARRALVTFEEDRWVQARSGVTSSQNFTSSALLALADLRLGEREEALALVRTLARRSVRRTDALRPPLLAGLDRALAYAVVLHGGAAQVPSSVRVVVDGEAHDVELDAGEGELVLPSLDQAGAHSLAVEAPPGALVHVRARAEYALPWEAPGAERPPIAIRFAELGVDEDPPAADETTRHVIAIRNVRPRTLTDVIVRVQLPTGAELDERAYQELGWRTRERPTRVRNTLELHLRSLLAGREVELPLTLRWTLSGSFSAFGVTAASEARPDLEAVLVPRRVEVSR